MAQTPQGREWVAWVLVAFAGSCLLTAGDWRGWLFMSVAVAVTWQNWVRAKGGR